MCISTFPRVFGASTSCSNFVSLHPTAKTNWDLQHIAHEFIASLYFDCAPCPNFAFFSFYLSCSSLQSCSFTCPLQSSISFSYSKICPLQRAVKCIDTDCSILLNYHPHLLFARMKCVTCNCMWLLFKPYPPSHSFTQSKTTCIKNVNIIK